jgi:hypothetical protein
MLERIFEIATELEDDPIPGSEEVGEELKDLATDLWASLEQHGYQHGG